MNSEEINKFKQLLHTGEVTFSYTKKNGEVREARGTLAAKLLPAKPVKESTSEESTAEAPAKKRQVKEGTIIYYDLDKAAFRSFNESQFIGLI